MNKSVDYFIHSHDPILGIKEANLTDRLDHSNWHCKAITRSRGERSHYIYLSRATNIRTRKRYCCVNIYDLQLGVILSQELFESPEAALKTLNQPPVHEPALAACQSAI